MFFDFFSVKIKAESKATDEVFLGYFFGKAREKLEFKFICFPRRYSKQISVDLNLPLANFKQFINNFFQELLIKSSEVSEMTRELTRYLDIQIKKTGGRESLSLRMTKIIESDSNEMIKMEINELFENWTSSLEIAYVLETSTYEELTNHFLGDVDVSEFLDTISSRNDLVSMPEVYPIVDPLDGVSIDSFDIGDTIFCTILGFNNEDQQNKLIQEFPENFDSEGKNTVPIEATIISKEILPSVSKSFVLTKVHIGTEFEAKSIILRTIRLLFDPGKMKKRIQTLRGENNSESVTLADTMAKYATIKSSASKKLEKIEKNSGNDFFLNLLFILIMVGLIFIIVYFFLLS